MNTRLKRIGFYSILAILCISVAVVFAEDRTTFVAIFSIGLLIGLTADLLLWRHLHQVFLNRR